MDPEQAVIEDLYLEECAIKTSQNASVIKIAVSFHCEAQILILSYPSGHGLQNVIGLEDDIFILKQAALISAGWKRN